MGLTHVMCQFHNLPEALSARLEYLEGFGTEVIQKLKGQCVGPRDPERSPSTPLNTSFPMHEYSSNRTCENRNLLKN